MTEARPRACLVRHGETEWSRNGRHTSFTDLPLTPEGEKEAVALGRAFEGPRGQVLTSPLQRARHTAELAGLVPYEVLDDLHEWNYGELEGRTTGDIRREYPGWSIWSGPWPGGEDAATVSARADRVVARVLGEPPDRIVTLVAHGHFLRALAARWLGADVASGRWLALGTTTLSWLGWEHETRVIEHWNLAIGTGVP